MWFDVGEKFDWGGLGSLILNPEIHILLLYVLGSEVLLDRLDHMTPELATINFRVHT